MNPLQRRAARVTINVRRMDASGTEQDYSYTFVQHRMSINVSQGGGQFGNAKVEIFGVGLDTMNQIARLWLEALTPRVTDTLGIEVWDGKEFIPFFMGVISWSAVDASRQPDVALQIEANDAMALMLTVSEPYAQEGPISLRSVLEAVCAQAGFAVDIAQTVQEYQLTNVRLTGTALEQVGQLMSALPELTWFANLQRLVVRNANAPFEADAIPIGVDTGMVGYPVYSTSGLSLSTIFDPRIRPGLSLDVLTDFDFVNRTKWVTGVLQHSLQPNTRGGAWVTAIAAQSWGTKGNEDGNTQ